jgi:hypothetical protein
MKTFYKKISIILVIFTLIAGVYLHSSNDIKIHSLIPTAFASSLLSSNDNNSSFSGNSQVAADILFLSTLQSLKKIKIDTEFLNNSYFKSLKNNKISLTPVKAGRTNPFDQMGIDSQANPGSLSSVATNQATTITTNTAILNGTLNIISGVTDIYFVYGTSSQNLDQKLDVENQTLIGTFSKNLMGLIPQTNYFYKACAKISNVEVCGEVSSFRTN